MSSSDPTRPDQPLACVAVDTSGGTFHASVDGELDMSNSGEVIGSVLAAAGAFDPVVLDVSAVTFMDSHALAALHHLHHELTAANKSLVILTGADTVAARTLSLAGMDQVLPTHHLIGDLSTSPQASTASRPRGTAEEKPGDSAQK